MFHARWRWHDRCPSFAPSNFRMTLDRPALLVAEIMAYLSRHPGAADTTEGIQRWWLAADHAWDVEELERALARLVSEGALARRALPDGRVLYTTAAP
jgi:hypothetical protein